MEMLLLKDILEIFLLAMGVLLLFHRIKVPVTVGLLLTGVIAGPYGLGLISAVHEVEILAEIGVVLLLFAIGIEFSLEKLLKIKRYVLLGGSLQVALTTAAAALIVRMLQMSWNQAVFVGFLVALSSTAIVLKVLQESAEIDAPHGQTSLAILIFQDIIIVPMILLTPILAGKTANLAWELGLLVLKVAGIVALTAVLARWVVDRVLFQVVRTRSRELFLMSVLGICLAVAWLTSSIGLSLAMGAFLAGLVISESEYSHHAFSNILPFRDIFTSFFFVSIGMLLDLGFLLTNLGLILLIVLVIMFLKINLCGFIGTLLGMSFRSALLVGFALAQIGEFSFILAGVGLKEGLLEKDIYQIFLSAAVVSMALTPFMIISAGRLTDLILKLPLPKMVKYGVKPLPAKEPEPIHDHLIIVGFGLNGRNVARAAKQAGIQYMVLEMNPATVREAVKRGEPISFSDATQEAALDHAHIKTAKVMVVAIPDAPATKRITFLARHLNPRLHIIIRTRFLNEVEGLYRLGANDVIPEEFETSVGIFGKVLKRFGIPEKQIQEQVAALRSHCYETFRIQEIKDEVLTE